LEEGKKKVEGEEGDEMRIYQLVTVVGFSGREAVNRDCSLFGAW